MVWTTPAVIVNYMVNFTNIISKAKSLSLSKISVEQDIKFVLMQVTILGIKQIYISIYR